MRQSLLLGLIILALPFGACKSSRLGSQPKPSATPTTNPTPIQPSTSGPSTLPADVLTVLKRYTFAQSDLPSGYSAGGLVEVPNQQAAYDYGDQQAAQKEISDTGRQGGLGQQIFPKPGVAGSIGVSIELFKDAPGAQHWAAEPPPMQAGLNPMAIDPGGSFGEAVSAIHWKQGAQSGYVINFSRGRVVYGVGLAAPAGQEALEPVQELAHSLDQKASRQSN